MEIGRIGLAVVALVGGGYAVTGEDDFEVTVLRSPSEVHSAFSSARTFSGGLSAHSTARIRTERPSPNELIYYAGDPGEENGLRIALTFTPDDDGKRTVVTAAIDVPAIEYDIDGEAMVLSESKVEDSFEEDIAAIAVELSQGRDARDELNAFRDKLDLVSIALDPDAVDRLQNGA